ncbi:hypothetical protein HU200_046315 [Digitaria exilis]|uniref:DUF6598 domain-containing protein n=1 Tax=Digitaria exilis TaxID=1010633 RepID=A0A835ECL7_9POAL|nr:hypothetical protein HU200_046315 [Digitaria exilis]
MTLTRKDGAEAEEQEQYGEERCLAKKPRVDGDEELLEVLKRFRSNWTRSMSPYTGPVDAITVDFGPMRYTDSGPPRFGSIHYDAMEIFSIKVTHIEGGLEWPLHVYGLVAVRDSMDHRRNILFHRSKNNYQVLTAEVCKTPVILLHVIDLAYASSWKFVHSKNYFIHAFNHNLLIMLLT